MKNYLLLFKNKFDKKAIGHYKISSIAVTFWIHFDVFGKSNRKAKKNAVFRNCCIYHTLIWCSKNPRPFHFQEYSTFQSSSLHFINIWVPRTIRIIMLGIQRYVLATRSHLSLGISRMIWCGAVEWYAHVFDRVRM